MHGCLVLVNAGVDSMGGVIDGGVEVSSAPSPHQSSDLEKTQAELRETFTTAEKFRRELEFLQKGGDPLDLKVGSAASVSLQSTSLTDQHPEQFVTSEVKGSFAVTASPHGDSVESSGRLGGALSVGEPNSADNLMLFDGNNNKSVSGGLELPEKSYKRRIRSRPNRHGSRDTKGLVVVHNTADNHDHKSLSNSNSTPKSPNNVGLDLKNLGSSNTHLDIKSNGTQETPLSMSSEKETLSGVDAHTVDDVAVLGQSQTKGFDPKSSCRQTDQSLDDDNKNEVSTSVRNVDCNGSMELDIASKEAPNMEGNDVNTVKDDINNNEIGPTLKEEEGLKGSESALLHDLKKSVCSTGSDLDGCTTSDIDKKPLGTESTTLPPSCSNEQNNLKLATKEHEDSILEEARIIEEKRKRIAGLSALIPKSESNHRSHWSFVLEEMSWLANDFAQERLWKVTASAQISKKAACSSRVRFQQQKPLWEQKAVAHTLSESVMEFWNTVQVKCKETELEESKKDSMTGLDEYGKRFLEYNNSSKSQYNLAQAPVTPDRISDLDITDILWEDNLTEESLFYMVPPGAIEAYRKSIESHLLQSERTGSSMQDDVDASGYDDMADNTLEEEEGETSTYYLPGAFEGSRMLSKPTQKKRKHGQQFKSYIPRSYDTGADMSFPQTLERNMGKRPGTSVINVSIPTKRVRTASRLRFIGSGYINNNINNSNNNNNNNNSNSQAPNRADASSGDTNSFQDEQSGYQIPQNNNMEAESVGDYEKQLHFDMTEVSNRPKKKKKGPTFDHRWQHDSGFQNDQKEHSKRRLDIRQFDSNGNSVGSQMSNMSNPNKFMKLLVRDRGRKAKSLKTAIGHQGSGSPWSLFEDQALVVLVHDMGANWELISDAINSTLQFKCISRNSKECKERHKILMDRSSGDGADSAEDSGSSQPYPSTLPGIPEGSARQLFQRLQGPMEEDTLKSHFEKLIVLSRKLHFKKSQKDNQDPKQLQQPHGSHALALSQVCPNNLNGGPVLTPLDLCEPITPTPDFLPVGYQVPHTSSTPSSSVFGKPNPNPNPNSPSVNVREGRYGIPRMEDQQHRMQQYNQMMSARNMQQQQQPPSSSGPHSVRMLPGGNGNNGMGVMSAMNRGMMMMPRPPLSSNSVRSRDPPHMIRNQEGGSGTGIGNFTQPPAVQPYPMSPHMPPHHLPTTTNPQHPAFGMQMLKERQRLRQQQFAAAASNPTTPRGQPVPSSPQQSQSPIGTNPPVTQHLQKPGPVGGVVRSPQGVQRRPPQQFQAPPGGRQQLAAAVKGGGASGVTNGFVAEHHLVQSSSGGGGNVYSGPSGLNPTSPLIQKRFPGQSQQQQKSKLMNPSQMTPAQKIILQNRKAAGNSSELLLPTATNTTSTSAKTKLQARGLILTKPPSSDDVAAADRKKTEAEAAKQSSSDNSLKPSNNSNSESGGVQWQKQQQPSS